LANAQHHQKEIRELLTPASIASMVVVAVIFALVGQMVGSPMNEVTDKPTIGVVNQDEGLFPRLPFLSLTRTPRYFISVRIGMLAGKRFKKRALLS